MGKVKEQLLDNQESNQDLKEEIRKQELKLEYQKGYKAGLEEGHRIAMEVIGGKYENHK